MIRGCRRIVVPLALLLLAACGAGDPQSDAARELPPADDEAALTPDISDDAARLEDAEPTSARFQLGGHYERLSPTQPTSSSPDKIEVAEVFWYGCPHCYAFEPYLERWSAQTPDDVSFVRIPALWNPVLRIHARAFYTARALGKLDEMHSAFFTEIHENGNPLFTRGTPAEFFAPFDFDAAVFVQALVFCDSIDSDLQLADTLIRSYRITIVPTII